MHRQPTARFVSPGAYSPPLGTPLPSPEDRAEAERMVSKHFGDVEMDPYRRADMLASFALIAMQARRMAEFRRCDRAKIAA